MKQHNLLVATLATTTENKFIELEIYYSLGGMNYFSGNSEKRGYWASAMPITIEHRNGYECRSFIIGGGERGHKDFLEETARFSAKRLETLRPTAAPVLGRLLQKVLNENPNLVLTPEAQTAAQPFLTAAATTPATPAPSPNAVKAAPAPLPYTIRTIIEQMGGRGLTGAFVYIGADQLVHKCPPGEEEYRSGYRSKETDEGYIDYEVGLQFRVNGKRGENWKMVVVYEPDDTYSVWLWTNKPNIPGKAGEVIEHIDDVYCDALKETVEHMYDRAIKARNQGFIPLSR